MKNRRKSSRRQHISKLQSETKSESKSQSEKGVTVERETTKARSKGITTEIDEPAGPQKFFWSYSSPNPSDDDDDDDDDDVLDSDKDDPRDPAAFAKHSQRMLELSRLRFRDRSYYGPEDEQKTCIWSGGDSFSWTEKSAGISWIGVRGTELVCVLSSSKQKVLRWRPYGRWQMSVRSVHANAVADMGFWADTSTKSTEFRRRIAQSSEVEGPFAVVSVAPNSVVDDKYLEISDKCQQRALRAINFLQAELKDRSSLSFEETIRMAVCALKYLLGPKFKPDEIEAFGFLKLKGPAVPNGADLRKAAMDLETSS